MSHSCSKGCEQVKSKKKSVQCACTKYVNYASVSSTALQSVNEEFKDGDDNQVGLLHLLKHV